MKSKISPVIMTLIIALAAVGAYAQDVHSVIAQKPFYLTDGLTGTMYRSLKGYCTMNWKDATRYGSFTAKVSPILLTPVLLEYEFTLVSVGNASSTEIEGLWDIKRNGVLVASGIVGKLYGIDAPVGGYFKFYGGDSQSNTFRWHLSAYVTSRFDF